MSNSYRPDPNRTHTEATVEAVAAAMEAANEENILVDFDVMAGEMVVDWCTLAEVAIEAHTAALTEGVAGE